jgi:hypothetical protein
MSATKHRDKKRSVIDLKEDDELFCAEMKSVQELEEELRKSQKLRNDAEERATKAEERAKKAEAMLESLKAKTSDPLSEEEVSDDDDDESLEDRNDPWTIMFNQLREYRISNGNCMVPTKTSGKLGTWVNNQRLAYRNSQLGKKGQSISQVRIDKLETIGFYWGKAYPSPISWDDSFEELARYQKAMGNCNIHVNQNNPSKLAKWVSAQRTEYKRFRKGRGSLLTPEKIEKLKEIGFNWKGPRLN